ncbi:AAA family ATPase [Deinococcus altitudinis]|uniref:AAA family ATPase n=1 Tax=Deinococcus altitudinis TaxID=468914 RepID=UPI0038927CFA
MTNILITGMSGSGKSSALAELARRGHRTVDTDSDEWCEWVTVTGQDGPPERDWIWREDRLAALLEGRQDGHLFVADCKSNQGKFYDRFLAVVLLTAPVEVLRGRVMARENNPYGKSAEEWAQILDNVATVEPLLRRSASHVIRTDRPLSEVGDQLEAAAGFTGP